MEEQTIRWAPCPGDFMSGYQGVAFKALAQQVVCDAGGPKEGCLRGELSNRHVAVFKELPEDKQHFEHQPG